MAYRKPRYFLLTYIDDDAKTFNTIGPISFASDINVRTETIQQCGRKVHLSSSNPEIEISKVPSIESWNKGMMLGYTYDPNLKW